MFKKIGALLVTLLGLALLVYSASRSLDFITMTLPADKAVLAYFGLAALDGGLIAWALAYLYGSRGGWQRGISLLMVIVDFLGAVAMFTLDTVYNTGKAGMTTALTPDEILTAVIGLSAVIAVNIGATVAHHLTDVDRLKTAAEEEAFSAIEDQALKQINQNSQQLAAELAPQIAGDWMANTRARYVAALGTGARLSLPRETIEAVAIDPEEAKRNKKQPAPAFLRWPKMQRAKVHYNQVTAQPAEFEGTPHPNGSKPGNQPGQELQQ